MSLIVGKTIHRMAQEAAAYLRHAFLWDTVAPPKGCGDWMEVYEELLTACNGRPFYWPNRETPSVPWEIDPELTLEVRDTAETFAYWCSGWHPMASFWSNVADRLNAMLDGSEPIEPEEEENYGFCLTDEFDPGPDLPAIPPAAVVAPSNCAVLSLWYLTGLPYAHVHSICTDCGYKESGMKDADIERAAANLGLRLVPIRKWHRKTAFDVLSTIRENHPTDRFLFAVVGHSFCVLPRAALPGILGDKPNLFGPSSRITKAYRVEKLAQPTTLAADEGRLAA
jgi:hypothetical protein